ncbi:MAG: hypothetical protein NZ770_09095 [Candidatus Poseidoniaceae archaeon]|nr:hypothetical protein [Candidatus Poseidoniaceae archaeon]
MKLGHVILLLMLPLAAISPMMQPTNLQLKADSSADEAPENDPIVVVDLRVHWTFSAGDHAIYDTSYFEKDLISELENESEFDRASLNWIGEMRVDILADGHCSFPAYSGQCHRMEFQSDINVTAFNDTDNWDWTLNLSSSELVLFPVMFTGWEQYISVEYQREWYVQHDGGHTLQGTSWNNSTSETHTTGYKSNMTTGDVWTEYQQDWDNWTSEAHSEYHSGGVWYPGGQQNYSGNESGEQNVTFNATEEVTIEISGYNTANSSASGPTEIQGLEIERWEDYDDGEGLVNDETGILSESGMMLSDGEIVLESYRYQIEISGDADGDGVNDVIDLCPDTPSDYTPPLDSNGCSWEQRDDDSDGVLNPVDDCADTTAAMTDIDANGCADEQRDDDGDGVLNPADRCADTPLGEEVDTEPPWQGCSLTQKDSDNDGVSDADDACEGHDDNIDTDGDGIVDGCDSLIDNDGDGVANAVDLCEGHDDAIDLDEDGIPDGCDDSVDRDGDGVADADDECMGYDDTIDEDGDGIIDGCDYIIDSDGDGISDELDACSGFDDRIDVDADGMPDGCDDLIDSDGDDVANDLDECPGKDDGIDVDQDGIPDGCDTLIDSDSDGVSDAEDSCQDSDDNIDVDADGIADGCDDLLDNDADGVANDADDCSNTAAGAEVDESGCEEASLGLLDGLESGTMMTRGITIVAVIILLFVALVLFRRGKDDDEFAQEDNMFEQQGNAGWDGGAHTNVDSNMHQSVQASHPQPAVSVLQQWTDAQGYTWRRLSDGRNQWWNGTDWQDG